MTWAAVRSTGSPAMLCATSRFCIAVSVGSRWNCCSTMPIWRPRKRSRARGRERRQILSIDDDRAAGGHQEPGDQVQERRLAAAGGSDDQDVALRFQDEFVEPQHIVAAVVAESQLLEANHRAARASRVPQSEQRP